MHFRTDSALDIVRARGYSAAVSDLALCHFKLRRGCLCVVIAVAALPLAFALIAGAAERTLVEWTFDRDHDLQGWQPNGQLTNVAVAGGVLTCRAVGHDPILELRPMLELRASPWQAFVVRFKCDRDGECEVFWSNTAEGRYGGFTQEKATRFLVRGDNQWHDCRILPFWQSEGRIVRLRFDLFEGATFAVDAIRVTEMTMPEGVAVPEFDFTKGLQGWQPTGNAALSAVAEDVFASPGSGEGFVLAPPIQADAEARNYVSVRMAVDRGERATLVFASDQKPGLHSLTFPIAADGREHTYNVDMISASDWRGRIVALGLRPSDEPEAKARLRWLKVSAEPQGPPQVRVHSFLLEEALPRAGMPATLAARLTNTGGETATNLEAKLSLPPGIQVADNAGLTQQVPALGFGEEVRLAWRVQTSGGVQSAQAQGSPNARRGAMGADVTPSLLTLCAANAESVEARAVLHFTPRPSVPKNDYVPEPKPVRGPTEVGVYYFPGWKAWSQWQPLQGFPERKPVLGWYREGDPEVADWHIKWAVEHGITFFAYDWYWSQGARQLEHALHDGYFKARYRHLLKFCLLWANHNPPRTSSQEDCLAVTRYWIENYFRRPEPLTFEGKPVVIIFSTDRLTSDLGSAKVKSAFDAMREECRRAGLNGLCLVACVGSAGQARLAAEEGYDAVTAYNWPGLGLSGDTKRGPYETLLEGYQRNWEHIREQASLPLIVPVCGGWDSRPWHGENNLVRYGRTPDLFKRHLEDARQFLSRQRPATGTCNFALIEAWNEWGEGSYIEPHREFGFGYLDAIREVFTTAPKAHEDLAPADVGLGPYDLPPAPPPQTAWDFARGDEGWVNVMHLADVHAQDGALTARTTGNDPAFFGPPMQARAGEFSTVVVRMRLQRADGTSFHDHAQLFWRTTRLPESEASSLRFEVAGDGQWHDYALAVGANRRWQAAITRLRLDPCNQAQVQVAVDAIRLRP